MIPGEHKHQYPFEVLLDETHLPELQGFGEQEVWAETESPEATLLQWVQSETFTYCSQFFPFKFLIKIHLSQRK